MASEGAKALATGQEEELGKIGAWVVDTCVLHGARPELAHRVASLFVAGLRREWEAKERSKA